MGYRKDRIADSWKADNLSEYLPAVPEAYEKMFGEYGNGFEQFSWRKEITGRVISGEARLLENKETEDQGIILQLWELSDGSRMQVSVSANGNPEKLTQNGQPSPAFEYQFRYRSGFSRQLPGSDQLRYKRRSAPDSTGFRKENMCFWRVRFRMDIREQIRC